MFAIANVICLPCKRDISGKAAVICLPRKRDIYYRLPCVKGGGPLAVEGLVQKKRCASRKTDRRDAGPYRKDLRSLQGAKRKRRDRPPDGPKKEKVFSYQFLRFAQRRAVACCRRKKSREFRILCFPYLLYKTFLRYRNNNLKQAVCICGERENCYVKNKHIFSRSNARQPQ